MEKCVRSIDLFNMLRIGRGVFGALVLTLLLTTTARAQSNVYTKWVENYVASPAGIPVAEISDGEGNVYVTGSIVSESVTVKYDSQGNTLWRAFANDLPGSDPYSSSNPSSAQGSGLAVGLDAQGNVYVLSVVLIPNSPVAGPPVIVTAKYNSSGVRQWVDYLSSTYTVEEGLEAFLLTTTLYTPYGMAVSPGGDVYTAFSALNTQSNPQASTANLIKYDANGKQLWWKTASPTPYASQTPFGIQLDASENAYLLNLSQNPSNSGQYASEIFKFDPNGNILNAFGASTLGMIGPASSDFAGTLGTYSFPYVVPFYVDGLGNSYVAGGGPAQGPPTPQNIFGPEARIVAKFNAGGTLDWVYAFGAPLYNGTWGIDDLAVDPAGEVFLAQTLNENGGNPDTNGTDIVVNKFSSAGQLLWTTQYNGHGDGSGFDAATAIAVDSGGSAYVTGKSTGTVQTPTGVFNALVTIKYDSEGNAVWTQRYQPNTSYSYGPPAALTVSGSDVWVTGVGDVLVPSVSTGSATQEWLTINYGQDALEANPAVLNFGNQTENTSSSAQTVTLTNISSSTWILKTINYSGPIHFTNNCVDTIKPGDSCELQVTFTPTAPGPASGSIIIRDTSPGNAAAPQTITVTGTGVS
jgi:hypothetical protein